MEPIFNEPTLRHFLWLPPSNSATPEICDQIMQVTCQMAKAQNLAHDTEQEMRNIVETPATFLMETDDLPANATQVLAAYLPKWDEILQLLSPRPVIGSLAQNSASDVPSADNEMDHAALLTDSDYSDNLSTASEILRL